MDVFLVPVAADRYELYCEEPDEPEVEAPPQEPPPQGSCRKRPYAGRACFRRVARPLRALSAAAARGRPRGAPARGEASRSCLGRLKARLMRWVAEWTAEQRLLWQLRGKDAACLLHPDDMPEADARQILQRSLQKDWERHRFWLIIDSLGLIGSGLL